MPIAPETTDIASPANLDPGPAPPPPVRGGGSAGLWVRVALAVAMLGASAGARALQLRRVDQILRDGRVSPFRLADLPRTLGPWDGDDEALDPAIARATGSTDSISRVYQHRITGQRIALIVLFGPSTEMYIHAPEVCYAAAGYEQTVGPRPRAVTAGGAAWPFHELVFSRGEGGLAELQEVYYTWRYSGAWTPGLLTQKGFERIPGMFKVHVARGVKDTEMDNLDVGNPCEDLLARLMPEIDRRIASGHAPAAPASR